MLIIKSPIISSFYILVHRHRHDRSIEERYYNANEDGWSEEAEWTFGLSWLAIIYAKIGKAEEAKEYLDAARETVTKDGTVPELYFSNSTEYNDNTPLGWSESMFVVALHAVNEKHLSKK
jgi:phosphorylase kinase alpha/beta subunit